MQKVCAIIPARAGSKGLKGKNVRMLGGMPLLGHSVQAARQAACVERVLLSTDCPEIAAAGKRCGAEVPFLRPPELAGDASAVFDAVEHLLTRLREQENYSPEYVLLLQPTSPFRSAGDIEGAYALLNEMDAQAVVSVTPASDHPYLSKQVDGEARLRPFVESDLNAARRQDLPPAYMLNGAIYLRKTADLLATRSWCPPDACAYCMPRERSVDIDTVFDFELAEWLLGRQVQEMVK